MDDLCPTCGAYWECDCAPKKGGIAMYTVEMTEALAQSMDRGLVELVVNSGDLGNASSDSYGGFSTLPDA